MERSDAAAPDEAILSLAVLAGVLVALSTELLSLFGAFRRPFVVVAWALGGGALAVFLRLASRRRLEPLPGVRAAVGAFPFAFLSGAAILLVTGLVAVVAPSNNYDSMSYHMPRVLHWIQNGSVRHYATSVVAQIANPPWAEYAIAHLHLLWGGDRFANLVQWVALAGCLPGVWSIARRLGGGTESRALAALLAVTLPMAILQASSTQTDLAASLWAVAFVANGLAFVQDGRWRSALLAGASLGLGLLTKPTFALFLAPFAAWFCWAAFRARRRAVPILVAALVVLVLNGFAAVRHVRHFSWPVGPKKWSEYHRNAGLTAGGLASNLIRNAALHLELKGDRIRPWMERMVRVAHRAMDVDPDDARFTSEGQRFSMPPPWNHEDLVGNTAHLVLFVPVLVCILLGAGPPRERLFALSLAAGFVLFCAVLKWQPWGSRFHLPLFVLAAPLVAVWLERRSRRFLREALAVVLVVLAAAPLLANATRPLLPRPGNVLTTDRIGLLFAARKADRASYEEVAAAIRERRSRSVGLVVEVGDWEYPFWVLLGRRADRPRIEHVSIPAPRSAHSVAVGSLETLSPEVDPAFQPDVIVRDLFSDGGPPGPASFRYRRGVYRLEMAAGSLRLFVLDAPGGLDLGANH